MNNINQIEIPSLDWSPYPIEFYFTQTSAVEFSSASGKQVHDPNEPSKREHHSEEKQQSAK
jgi:hypothetical protein